LDIDSIPVDILELLAREAPDPIPKAIGAHLKRLGRKRRTHQESVHLYLEAREDPHRILDRWVARGAVGEIGCAEVDMIAGVAHVAAAELLVDVALRGAPGVRYAAAEAACHHSMLSAALVHRLLRESSDAGVVAAAAAWVAAHPDGEFVEDLMAVGDHMAEITEREVLRALRAVDAGAATARFRRAAGSNEWSLQAAGWLGLLSRSVRPASGYERERLDPRAVEIIDGHLT
jgi:hypothetical protein